MLDGSQGLPNCTRLRSLWRLYRNGPARLSGAGYFYIIVTVAVDLLAVWSSLLGLLLSVTLIGGKYFGSVRSPCQGT